VVLIASATGALGLLGFGCGSRTSMLDSDAYSSSGVGGFGNSAGSGNTSGSSSKAGSSSDPNAVDPRQSASACEKYCKGYRVQCARELGDRDCEVTCAQEVNNNGKQCQTAGIRVLECLAPLFPMSGPSQGCEVVSNRAAAACSAELAKFQNCAPSPKPTNPGPKRLPDNCTLNEAGSGGDCFRMLECEDGPYLVRCSPNGNGATQCVCLPPSGQLQSLEYGSVGDACELAANDCGFL
jgi:hypothetical protein